MHEMSIVGALIDQVQEEVERCGGRGRVLRLELAIGRLSGVNVESFRFAFEMLSPQTLVEGAQMQNSQPKATCRCRACQMQTQIDELVAQCPGCGSSRIFIEGGRELLLQAIELEE